ncbi:MAG TPA: TetR/AcrR family transcriptional regulator [Stellaceae bacterium]|nr:TetR/AcrR family transcriptional regulator [Stellaceae bacterium]
MTPEMARAVKEATAPPRVRILNAARELFYRCGIHAVGVDAIAEAADTNKTTLYRHFESKDELVAECLRELGREFDTAWAEIERAHVGQPKDQLLAWLRFIAEFKLGPSERGCAFANAAVELPDANHPARRVIEEFKSRHRDLAIELCRKAGLRDPELLADELFLLCEGARSTIQSLGPRGPAERLAEMLQTLVAAHTPSGS